MLKDTSTIGLIEETANLLSPAEKAGIAASATVVVIVSVVIVVVFLRRRTVGMQDAGYVFYQSLLMKSIDNCMAPHSVNFIFISWALIPRQCCNNATRRPGMHVFIS